MKALKFFVYCTIPIVVVACAAGSVIAGLKAAVLIGASLFAVYGGIRSVNSTNPKTISSPTKGEEVEKTKE